MATGEEKGVSSEYPATNLSVEGRHSEVGPSLPETRKQGAQPCLKEEGAPEPKALRYGGGCECSLGTPRKAGLGTGLPVALEWNARYSYLDIKEQDPRRLENMKRLRFHMWYFNTSVRQGPYSEDDTELMKAKLPEVQQLIAAESKSNLCLVAPAPRIVTVSLSH